MRRFALASGMLVAIGGLVFSWPGGLRGADPASRSTASPGAGGTPVLCGRPVSHWGAATASGVRIDLQRIEETAADGTPSPSPVPGARLLSAEIQLSNQGDRSVTVALTDFTLTTCDGRRFTAIPGRRQPALSLGALTTGSSRSGWVTFALPPDAAPARLAIAINRSDQVGARVEFELVIPGPRSDSTTCGAKTSRNGAAGGDAVGGDAVGGSGANGGDAVGGDAVGGNGGNGGDAAAGQATSQAGGACPPSG